MRFTLPYLGWFTMLWRAIHSAPGLGNSESVWIFSGKSVLLKFISKYNAPCFYAITIPTYSPQNGFPSHKLQGVIINIFLFTELPLPLHLTWMYVKIFKFYVVKERFLDHTANLLSCYTQMFLGKKQTGYTVYFLFV